MKILLRKILKEILEIKNTITDTNNIFDGLISWVNIAEERISKLEKIKIEISKTVKWREKRLEKITKQNIQGLAFQSFRDKLLNFNCYLFYSDELLITESDDWFSIYGNDMKIFFSNET